MPGKQLTVNFGPQHPAAHGVLRLVMELSGEVRLEGRRGEGGEGGEGSVGLSSMYIYKQHTNMAPFTSVH